MAKRKVEDVPDVGGVVDLDGEGTVVVSREVVRRQTTEAQARTAAQMMLGRYVQENGLKFGLDMDMGRALERARGLARDTWEVDGNEMGRTDLMVMLSDLVAEGASLSHLCSYPGMPGLRTVLQWRANFEEFDEMMRLAEIAAAYRDMDEIKTIADNATAKDSYVANLRIGVRERLAAHRDPRRWNPKAPTPTGAPELDERQVQAQVKALLLANGERYLKEFGVLIVAREDFHKIVLREAEMLREMGVDVAKNVNFKASSMEKIAMAMKDAGAE